MPKYHTLTQNGDDYSDWIVPNQDNGSYKLGCCDCGLVHDVQFAVVEVHGRLPGGKIDISPVEDQEKYQVALRAKRNNRATGQHRRQRHKGK